MKFLVPLAALAAGVAAQYPADNTPVPGQGHVDNNGVQQGDCLANYIVTRCLDTEKPKAEGCNPTDYECQCAAHEAIASCYNNCPDDSRAAAARNEVNTYCAQVRNSRTTPIGTTPLPWATGSPYPTTPGIAQNTPGFSDDFPGHRDDFRGHRDDFRGHTGAAGAMVMNTGGVLLGFAGAAAALL